MLPKLHLICGKEEVLRPALCHVQITREDLRASDAHCLAIYPTADTALAKCELPEEPIYLHREHYKLLAAPSVQFITYDAENRIFRAIHKGSKPDSLVHVDKMDERYPDFEPLIPRWQDGVELSVLGINPIILLNLAEAIAKPGEKDLSLALKFSGMTRAVMAKSLQNDAEVKAIIMPVAVNEDGEYLK